MKNNDQNTNAFLIHISAFAGFIFPFGSIITPLILWQTLKERSVYLDQQGKEAVNFNISYSLYILLLGASFFPFFFGSIFNIFDDMSHVDFGFDSGTGLFGIFSVGVLTFFVSVVKVALIIIAGLKANKGEHFEYPFTIKFIK